MGEAARRRLSLGLTVVALVFATHYAVWGGEYDLGDIRELETARLTSVARIDSITAILDSVRVWADSLETDPAVIERVARERHSFIRPGERLFLFVEEPSP
ncbi:MAG: septum formation initiator family protein [Acidobacteriota bacterium]|nr:septum formation initiator family protein [Acidobacteriota bacterium]